MARRRCEVTSISIDEATKENLKYVLQSHYCNKMGQSAYIRSLIAKDAAEKRMIDNAAALGREVTIPQGWFGGSSGMMVV